MISFPSIAGRGFLLILRQWWNCLYLKTERRCTRKYFATKMVVRKCCISCSPGHSRPRWGAARRRRTQRRPAADWRTRCRRTQVSSLLNSLFESSLQGKSHLCIPFLGIARPQPQFPHSCVCERFIYSQDRSTYYLQQNRQTNRGNM